MKIIRITVLCAILLMSYAHGILAQNRLEFTVEQAEARFLERNLQLLAERYNIAMADAMILQARLFENPTLTAHDVNFWRPSEVADELNIPHASLGQRVVFSLELEQLITTAGTRRRAVAVERMAREIAVREFEALLLELKIELRTALYETIFLQSYLNVINRQQESIEHLVEQFRRQTMAGNIARTELIRLQASLIEIISEANELRMELNEQHRKLIALLNLAPGTEIYILPSESAMKNPDEIVLADLFELARNARPEFLLADLNVQYSERVLRYEQSHRVPDLTLSLQYSRYDGMWGNFVGVGVGFDIPVFNRNQGNIRVARFQVEQEMHNAEFERNAVFQEIVESFNNYRMSYNFYRQIADSDFFEELENLLEIYSRNLLNRNINMLEFIDFMEAYRTAKEAVLTAQRNLNTSFAELQFSVNQPIN